MKVMDYLEDDVIENFKNDPVFIPYLQHTTGRWSVYSISDSSGKAMKTAILPPW